LPNSPADSGSPHLPVQNRIEKTFHDRVERLPSATRRLSFLAAGAPVGDAALLWRAAKLPPAAFPESRRIRQTRQKRGLHGVMKCPAFRQPLNRHEMLLNGKRCQPIS
jgi:hypothetical protein